MVSDDFGVNTTICGIYLNRVENRDFKPIHILDEPISIHLEVLNLSRADVKWNATKYEDHVATDIKNTGIGKMSNQLTDICIRKKVICCLFQIISTVIHYLI